MKSYFKSYEDFKAKGGSIKSSTITYEELLAVLTMHMERLDKQFSLTINGHLPKPLHEILDDAFEQSHLYKAFYTQHCANRSYRYRSLSKNRVKVDFTLSYRMNRTQEKDMLAEITEVLAQITTPAMSTLQKIVAVHDYIVRTYSYEMHTKGSPFAVSTFMAEKRGVCMAYALLFEKMMHMLDIPCYYVIGKADGEGDAGHAWNMVQLDGDWYHVDVTWDDIGHAYEHHEIRYCYFLLTDDQIANNHQWDLDLYPPCTSDHFHMLHQLYDACIVGDELIYPHPKTACLTAMSLKTLKARKLADIRVQQCTFANGIVYVSNYSDGETLYSYHIETAEITKLSADKVKSIARDLNQVVVTYDNDKTKHIELEHTSQTIDAEAITVNEWDEKRYTEVTMMSFGDSWLATYNETSETLVALKSADGVALFINEPVKQLTVSLELDKGIQLQMTANRKQVQFEQAAKLIVPIQLVANDLPALQKHFAEQLVVKEHTVILEVNRSLHVQFKR
ncbi:transglutaminase domain-containing protein [Solibacillus daqui]|uniref:transglutaminase domain-containing protein n=1 Tax=Solibacillus daqui TaxID=2912187 RepID=UPI0023672F59|nr:transglutaminase domain-containing protein [Solibacillus daqui]